MSQVAQLQAIGRRIRWLRGPQSQRDFAAELHISATKQSNIEGGQKLTLAYLLALRKRHGISLEELVDGTGLFALPGITEDWS